MIKKIAILLALSSSVFTGYGQQDNYRVEIDLTAAQNDQVPVTVYPPPSDSQFVEYHMARVVPGTYDISDFGRFVVDFSAYDEEGNLLETEQLTTNQWRITSNGKLHKINYRVHDSWDTFQGYGDNVIFEPGGTNINSENNVFVINTFGFIGYIDSQQFQPYEVKVLHQEGLYGATSLKRQTSGKTEDIFIAEDFNFLADGPIMYSEPDTVSRTIGNANVIVSVYSPNKVLSAKEVMDNITDLMLAQSKYLGGELPVDRYAYLIYLNDQPTLSGAMGALEHSYSSVYSLPEAGVDLIGQTVRDVASHEFFHIVTPLNIHSEEIGQFDYINPEMSKHLWLYEGVTEYSSMHVQVKYNLYSPEQFLNEISDKLRGADRYPSGVSFTAMSENILQPEYAKMYGNVYQKGALIGMCLDLYLIKYSNGERDLQWLMRELAKKYGKEKSFEDDRLFEVIESLTYPEIGEFLETYVAGTEPLPIKEVLSWAGINYFAEKEMKEITLGKFTPAINEEGEIIVGDLSEANDFAKDLGLKEGDIFVEFNGKEFSLATARKIMSDFRETAQPGDKVTMIVKRDKKGKLKKRKLKAKALEVTTTVPHGLEFNSDLSNEQYKVLQAWIVAGK